MIRVVCGWCGRMMQMGDKPTPVSHGICMLCMVKFENNEILIRVPESKTKARV